MVDAPYVAPMLASSGRPSNDLADWVAETKLDGWRAIATVHPDLPGGLCVRTRTGRDITDYLPELRSLTSIGCPVVLDGELVADAGRCDNFYAITSRLSRRTDRGALTFVAFDMPWLDGLDVTGLPYDRRRASLVDLDLPSPAVVMNAFDGRDLDAVLAACDDLGVEGVVIKRRRSVYEPGQRSTNWRKVKCPTWRHHAERRKIGRRP